MRMKTKQTVLLLSLFLLILANLYLWQAVFNLGGNLKVVFFDVGQGDSIFIETSAGHQILIDGGSSNKILSKLAGEIPFWDRTLDLVILTHPEKDHLGGLLWVLDRYEVANVLWTGILRDTNAFKRWQEKLKEEKANKVIAKAGQEIKAGRARIFILYPFESLAGRKYKDSNDTSIVARLIFGKNSFLFTGDATKKTEEKLLAEKVNIDSDVLKVGHHGSKTSTGEEFLEEVSPEIAVISCGRNNSYGHPHEIVLQRLKNFGINILRTDLEGDIKIKL